MAKAKKPDINKIVLNAHKLSVKKAIEIAEKTGTSLIVCENGKVKQVKPKFKYIRVPIESSKKDQAQNTKGIKKKK